MTDTLDAHRTRLEASLAKLQHALVLWRTSSAEYEAFKEELDVLPADASRAAMLAVGAEVVGDVEEVKALLGDRVKVARTRDQVAAAIAHRIGYVDENAAKVEKQVELLEAKLEKVALLESPEMPENEDGEKILDIQEELDEDGNVLSARVNGKDPKELLAGLETLEKVLELSGEDEKRAKAEALKDVTEKEVPADKVQPAPKGVTEKVEPATSTSESTPALKDVTEKVSPVLTEGGGYVRVFDDPVVRDEDWVKQVPGEDPNAARLRQEMIDYNLSEIGAVVAEVNLEETGEWYGHEDSDYASSDLDNIDDSDLSEDEDAAGRTLRRGVPSSYREEMEQLQRRVDERMKAEGKNPAAMPQVVLKPQAPQDPKFASKKKKPGTKKGVRFAEAVDVAPTKPKPAAAPSSRLQVPAPATIEAEQSTESTLLTDIAPADDNAIPFIAELISRNEIQNAGPTGVVKANGKAKKASVTAPAAAPAASAVKDVVKDTVVAKETVVAQSTLSDAIVERMSASAPVQAPTMPKKLSRFAAERAAAAAAATTSSSSSHSDEEPEQPAKTHATMPDFIIERPTPASDSEVRPPDDMDPDFHRAEVANSFHRLRNRMIHAQGGFQKVEKAVVDMDEDGEEVRVSRFKAARIKGLQMEE
ncbi:Prefoldin subunit-domain-containing protein [Geopyxis carbonaria]|nr:Prefoldin subunit-domain-containing protein [Geopyxis carbonaria]